VDQTLQRPGIQPFAQMCPFKLVKAIYLANSVDVVHPHELQCMSLGSQFDYGLALFAGRKSELL
jgi:hypothetical protein